MAYLVVEYDGGKQKQCNFKDERDVDKLLEVLAKEQPQIPLLSEAGEQALQKRRPKGRPQAAGADRRGKAQRDGAAQGQKNIWRKSRSWPKS